MSLFSTEPNTNELEQHLLRKFSGKRAIFNEIVESTWDWPFIEIHYREVLTDLRKAGTIKKIPVTTKTVERGFNGNDVAVFPRQRGWRR